MGESYPVLKKYQWLFVILLFLRTPRDKNARRNILISHSTKYLLNS
jgi:hypothetical protein